MLDDLEPHQNTDLIRGALPGWFLRLAKGTVVGVEKVVTGRPNARIVAVEEYPTSMHFMPESKMLVEDRLEQLEFDLKKLQS
jgi:hypothetical protein